MQTSFKSLNIASDCSICFNFRAGTSLCEQITAELGFLVLTNQACVCPVVFIGVTLSPVRS